MFGEFQIIHYLCGRFHNEHYVTMADNKVYITKTSSFFPNNPVENDEIEAYLGRIGDKKSRVMPIILRQNGIKKRYYAIDKNQNITHSILNLPKKPLTSSFPTVQIKGLFSFWRVEHPPLTKCCLLKPL